MDLPRRLIVTTMKRSKLRINPKLKNHAEFQKLFARWKHKNPLNEAESFTTRDFNHVQFWRPLELAAIENWSITGASLYYRSLGMTIPSSETILNCCHQEGDDQMEIQLNHTLEKFFLDLPSKLRRRFRQLGVIIIDVHEDPYYGTPDNPNVRGIKSKRSARLAYCYLTADLYTPMGKLTIALVLWRPGERLETVFGDLLIRIEFILTPKLIIFDGGFTSVNIMNSLLQKSISFVGRLRVSYRIRPLALAYSLTDNWEESRQWHAMTLRANEKKPEITVHVTFQRVHTEMKALVISPDLDWTPEEAEQWYGKRFNIDTGYRDKHQFQARTSSKALAVRYLILLFAYIFWNLCQIFFLIVKRGLNKSLSRVSKWRREFRTIKIFLLRDAVL